MTPCRKTTSEKKKAFGDIKIGPELNLKWVIMGEAQNLIFSASNCFQLSVKLFNNQRQRKRTAKKVLWRKKMERGKKDRDPRGEWRERIKSEQPNTEGSCISIHFSGKKLLSLFFFFFLSCFFSTVSMEIMVIYISNKKKRSLSLSLSLSLLHPPLHDFKAVGTGWEIQVNYNENFILRFIKLK